jgi:hypothetical protein
MGIEELRREYHREICQRILHLKPGNIPNIADKHSRPSVALAQGIVQRLGYPLQKTLPSGQTAGTAFEEVTRRFLEEAFHLIEHLRPGEWRFSVEADITDFDQYEHLADLAKILDKHQGLKAALGEYLIKPDIVIGRMPVSDEEINRKGTVLEGEGVSQLTPTRARNLPAPKQILHASISCKWTIRSDRSQNARTEGLNLIRNRKGHTPHIAIVTAEPYPQRIASVALGTGDIDCVYHIALPELEGAAKEYDNLAVIEMLNTLVKGKRLRDISDLPFDLAA